MSKTGMRQHFIVFSFLLRHVFSVNSVSSPIILFQQCWHESFPLSVYFQDSRDGGSELVYNIASNRPSNALVTSPNPFFPWSYEPICTEHLQTINDKLCVYTNTSFSNGRGISIFTTPRIAEEVVALAAFQDPFALPKKAINSFSNAWTTTALPGKGIGMLAAHDLQFGDRVTAYTAAFLAHVDEELPTMVREKFFRLAIERLPAQTSKSLYDLATVYGEPSVKAQDVVKANTFELHLGGSNHLAIFPETSRLNHACAPNAQYNLDPNLLTHFVHATRPIRKGEEITIAYTSPLDPTELRQQHLDSGFHFRCTCTRCTSPASDKSLSEIHALQSQLNDWSATSKASPKLADKLLSMYETEGLHGFMDIPYGFAALTYNAVGKSDKATEYAEKALRAVRTKDGDTTRNGDIWKEFLDGGAQEHWSYRKRVKGSGKGR